MYVNDINSVSLNVGFTMYADDVSLIIPNTNVRDLEINCNNLLTSYNFLKII